MPDYTEILRFLANNPPSLSAERQLHASMLELLANCLRNDDGPARIAALRMDEKLIPPWRQAPGIN